jgi:hypothetical protein
MNVGSNKQNISTNVIKIKIISYMSLHFYVETINQSLLCFN